MNRAATNSIIAEALRQLSKYHLERFCFCLRDRREDPRVTPADLGDQSVESISDMLVSKFSAAQAVKVTVALLRDLTCNSVADKLALLDKGIPTFRRTSAGELDVKPSQEALLVRSSRVPAKTAQEVETEARRRVCSEGGSPEGAMALVLSRYTLQFGKYRGQTFKWLLENDLQYAAFIITDHDKKVRSKNGRQNPLTQGPLMDNKNSLRKYAMAYPEFREVRSLRLANYGDACVGFGKYKGVKLRDLYQDPEKRSYVNYLRSQESVCSPGSLMEVAIHYILHCDRLLWPRPYKSQHRCGHLSDQRQKPQGDQVLAHEILMW